MSRKSRPSGVVVYKGLSLFEERIKDPKNSKKFKKIRKPIIVVATGVWTKSQNEKIGDMIQFWILRRDISPMLAAKIGEDFSICGDCKHRHFGSCYVNLLHGPHGIYSAFHRDNYIDFEPSMLDDFAGKSLRIGAYGDPAAVPYNIWEMFCGVSKNNTGYTHQWDNDCDPRLKNILMASVDDDTERDKAQSMGWRTFRIRTSENDSKSVREFTCPASQEGGKKVSCGECGACGGLNVGTLHRNPCIIAHGGGAQGFKVDRFIKGMRKRKNKKKFRKDFRWVLTGASL